MVGGGDKHAVPITLPLLTHSSTSWARSGIYGDIIGIPADTRSLGSILIEECGNTPTSLDRESMEPGTVDVDKSILYPGLV